MDTVISSTNPSPVIVRAVPPPMEAVFGSTAVTDGIKLKAVCWLALGDIRALPKLVTSTDTGASSKGGGSSAVSKEHVIEVGVLALTVHAWPANVTVLSEFVELKPVPVIPIGVELGPELGVTMVTTGVTHGEKVNA